MTDPAVLLAPAVPALAAVTGPVIACTGKRGAFRFANVGYAALGEVIAERTGLAYADAVSRLVLRHVLSSPVTRIRGPREGLPCPGLSWTA